MLNFVKDINSQLQVVGSHRSRCNCHRLRLHHGQVKKLKLVSLSFRQIIPLGTNCIAKQQGEHRRPWQRKLLRERNAAWFWTKLSSTWGLQWFWGRWRPTCHIYCCAIIWFHFSAFSLIMFAFAGSASFPTYQASFTNHFQNSFWLIWLLYSLAVRYEGQKAVSQGRPYGLLRWDFRSKVFTSSRPISSPLGPLCANGSCWLLWARGEGKVCGTVV